MSDTKSESSKHERLVREAFGEITGHSPRRESAAISPVPRARRQMRHNPPPWPRATFVYVATAVLLVGGVILTTHGRLLDSKPAETMAGHDISPNVQVLSPGEMLERFSSATAMDWTRNSDYVAEVEILSEEVTGPVEGGPVIGREVALNVKRVLWKRSAPANSLPGQVSLWAPGWIREEDQGTTSPRAFEGQPRLEVGHTYVIALVWIPRACSDGDHEEVAHWAALGANAVIPFDNGRLGYGESEGRSVDGDVDQAQAGTLERQLLGRGARQLVERLGSAPEEARPEVFPESTC